LYSGAWALAEEDLGAAERVFEAVNYERGQILVALTRSRLVRRRGNIDAAQECATNAHALAKKTDYKRAIILAQEELGDIHTERGDNESASLKYREALEQAEAIAPKGDLVYELCWRLARTSLEADRLEEAESLAERAVDLSRASFDRRELGNALVTLALVRHRCGRLADASAHTQEALEEFQAIQAPFELAQAHETAAIVSRVSEREAELGHLLEAKRLYELLGARTALERVLQQRRLPSRDVGDTTKLARPGGPQHAASPEPDTRAGTPEGIVLADRRMLEVAALCRRLGRVDATVLIEGETGTGKEILARLIHDSGSRASEPFVDVNCASLPGNLLETELFGHKKGAFTGAVRDHQGLLEQAGGGTIFLDEIDKSSLEFQAKLLRVVEHRMVRPIGSPRHASFRARILCASNREVSKLVDEGVFLADLLFRLSSFWVTVPPLRERPGDLLPLVELFVRESLGTLGDRPVELSKEALAALRTYAWPGNVRELKNVVQRAFFFAQDEGIIQVWHLPPELVAGSEVGAGDYSLQGRIEVVERREIQRAMRQAKGVKTEAARILGVSGKGLLDRLRRLGLE
jgi:transcriptional regulator with PAS, ATPase and Fis domain